MAALAFCCPQAALASDSEGTATASTTEQAQFFIAILKDTSIKPTSESELTQNLSGYSLGITVADALVDPQANVAGGTREDFSGTGITALLNAAPTNDQIAAVCSAFDPDTQTVLWYVVKRESDGWHVDGLLLDKDAAAGGSGETDGSDGSDGTDPEPDPEPGTDGEDGNDSGSGTTDGADDDADTGTEANGSASAGGSSGSNVKPAPAKANPLGTLASAFPSTTTNTNATPLPGQAASTTAAFAGTSLSEAAQEPASNTDTAQSRARSGAPQAQAATLAQTGANTAAAQEASQGFPSNLAAGMHVAGGAGMIALIGLILIAALISAGKTMAAKALEEQLRSATKQSGGRR